MDDERPSQTAEGALTMRALHQMLDDDPKILAGCGKTDDQQRSTVF